MPEVLRIAVKIGSAIETAHRAGVLHRDIKPSNILITAYGHPVLSDFGIAATLSESHERRGRSACRSRGRRPRCCSTRSPAAIASRGVVARRHRLLAARRTVAVRGAGRIEHLDRPDRRGSPAAKPQPIGRADVPASLERALQRAMSRKPEHRPASVLELVRELQAVETELGRAADADRGGDGRLGARDGRRPRGPHPHARRRRRAATSAAAAPSPAPPRAHGDYQPVGTVREASAAPRSTEQPPRRAAAGACRRSPGCSSRPRCWWSRWARPRSLVLHARGERRRTSPTVTDISGHADRRHRSSSPGTTRASRAGDSYQIARATAARRASSAPRSSASTPSRARPSASPSTVNRDGKTGDPSAEKCVDVPSELIRHDPRSGWPPTVRSSPRRRAAR